MLNTNVLVLNRVFQAVNITSVRRAFGLLYKGRGRAVLSDYSTYDFQDWQDLPVQVDDDCVSTPSRLIRIPRVIQLVEYDRTPKLGVKFNRANIYLRDRNRCQYCGKTYPTRDLNLDHVIPLSRGGQSSWENVVCSCVSCNHRKGNRLVREAGLKLVRVPRKPTWHPVFKVGIHGPVREEWRNFLDIAYWTVEL